VVGAVLYPIIWYYIATGEVGPRRRTPQGEREGRGDLIRYFYRYRKKKKKKKRMSLKTSRIFSPLPPPHFGLRGGGGGFYGSLPVLEYEYLGL